MNKIIHLFCFIAIAFHYLIESYLYTIYIYIYIYSLVLFRVLLPIYIGVSIDKYYIIYRIKQFNKNRIYAI